VDCRFEVVEELELEGYQIYAVEKWYVVPWFLPAPEVNHWSQGCGTDATNNGPHGIYGGS